jgi:RimJ/RimL family protein N-acetyltransferase
MPAVLGRRASRDLTAATPLSWDCVGTSVEAMVSLRSATSEDSARLLAWRNDALTREMSIDQKETAREEHDAWFTRSLASDERDLLIAEHEGSPVGTVRLDARAHGESEVSLTVAPEHRGRGFSASMLRAVETFARDQGVIRLVATIRARNDRSVRAFKSAGYYGFHAADGLVHCERRIVPFG